MITNLVETILTVSLATNVTISPETRSVPVPCPDGRIGCLVYHSKSEPVENPRWRTVETKITQIWKTSIPSLGKSWTEEELVSVDRRFETRTGAWVVDQERTEKLRAGGVLLTFGGEVPMISGPMNTFSNITWSLAATKAITNVWANKNEIPWEETPPPFLWPGETARTMHDSRGRFRAVGTNIVDGILSTTWKYEVTP